MCLEIASKNDIIGTLSVVLCTELRPKCSDFNKLHLKITPETCCIRIDKEIELWHFFLYQLLEVEGYQFHILKKSDIIFCEKVTFFSTYHNFYIFPWILIKFGHNKWHRLMQTLTKFQQNYKKTVKVIRFLSGSVLSWTPCICDNWLS